MMVEQVRPLAASVRASDDDFPGVVALLGPDWRLALSVKGDAYSLHQRVATDAGPVWVPAGGRSPRTLAKIVAKYGGKVDGLAALCATLPEDPAVALPGFVAASGAAAAAFVARDMTRDDYARVVARDGSLRLIVDADGVSFVLQWIAKRDIGRSGVRWQTLRRAATLSDLWAYVRDKVAKIVGDGRAGVLRGHELLPFWREFVRGLPERADAGSWVAVPPVPGAAAPPACERSAAT